jgi:hypothetical protein
MRSLVCLDLALDLMVLPLSYMVLNVGALLVCATAAADWHAVGRILMTGAVQ